jgi:hypothetical protein
MTRYYLDVSDELADRLQPVADERIVEALKKVANENESQHSDELAQYNSVKEIRNDEQKTPDERKRLELRWQRVIGRPRR